MHEITGALNGYIYIYVYVKNRIFSVLSTTAELRNGVKGIGRKKTQSIRVDYIDVS